MTIRGLQVPGPLIGGAARMVMSPNADWAGAAGSPGSATATLWYQGEYPEPYGQTGL